MGATQPGKCFAIINEVNRVLCIFFSACS